MKKISFGKILIYSCIYVTLLFIEVNIVKSMNFTMKDIIWGYNDYSIYFSIILLIILVTYEYLKFLCNYFKSIKNKIKRKKKNRV